MAVTTVTLSCVKCAGYPLEPCVHEARNVAVCPRCGGLWCEADQWDQSQLGQLPAEQTSPAGVELPESTPRPCVKCCSTLTIVSFTEIDGLLLERCVACGGVWFDKGEWAKLQALRTWQSQLPGLDRTTNWGEWFLQMFLRLPIEFNIRPRQKPWMTRAIIVICTIINFLLMDADLAERALAFVADGRASFVVERWHTLISYQFIHAGWLHLIVNMYFLYVLGDNVEDVLGHWWFLVFYLACGVAAAVAHILIAEFYGPPLFLVGARSGGISGVMAAYLLLFRNSRLTFMFFFWQYKLPAVVWITIWFFLQLGAAWLDPDGRITGVAMWAHVGGFVAGLVLILPVRRRLIAGHTLLDLLDRHMLRRSAIVLVEKATTQPGKKV